jgi:hypothetical protein
MELAMATIIETSKAGKATPAPSQARTAPIPPVDLTDAERFQGQPLVLKHKLDKAVEELFFFRASGRHHNERETSEVRGHARWKREACELCLALRDAIQAGALEPVKPKEAGE